jgi:alpha-L-fucosidase
LLALATTSLRVRVLLAASLSCAGPAGAADALPGSRNKPERLEWFRDAAFGMFIHWSVDGQLGTVISHSLVGSTGDFAARFFQDLPRTFNPRKFHPADWAALARLAGMKYVVFTTKHHSGFCMWDTGTTEFDVMSTPFARDITAEYVKAFRDQGIAVGFYFSPDDFHWLHGHGKVMARAPHPGVTPQENPGLLELDRAQLRELMTAYGPIDVVFLDGPPEGLREVVWDAQPDSVVTRGAIETPEQRLAGVALDRAWESCVTMGTEWNYKAAYETYKSGTEMIDMLIETRAKGGNLLLNVGPKPDGELPIEQEDRLRQIAAWTFVNGEAIYAVRPWVVTNEGDVWFTKRKGEDTVYAFLTKSKWTLGERRTFALRSLKATDATRVSVLGASGEVLEYKPEVDPRPTWKQEADGLHVSPMMSQRLYTNRQWYDAVVLKITNVKPALTPPVVVTAGARRSAGATSATLQGELKDLGQAASVEVGFQYRRKKGVEELYTPDDKWVDTPLIARTAPGPYSVEVAGLQPGQAYEYRAAVRHPLLTLYGEERTVEVKGSN